MKIGILAPLGGELQQSEGIAIFIDNQESKVVYIVIFMCLSLMQLYKPSGVVIYR